MEIATAVHAIKELDKDSIIPIAVKHLITDAFKCKICLKSPLTPPLIITKCCKTILGCENCANEWYMEMMPLSNPALFAGWNKGTQKPWY